MIWLMIQVTALYCVLRIHASLKDAANDVQGNAHFIRITRLESLVIAAITVSLVTCLKIIFEV